MRVRTTFQPDVVLEVTEEEADALRFQGLLASEGYEGEIPKAWTKRRDQKEEGQE